MGKHEKKKEKKGIGTIIYRIIMTILVCVMLFSGYKVFSIYKGYRQGTEAYNKIAKSVVEEEPEDDGRLKINWTALLEQNSDIVGWLYCEGTPINYPVVQGEDNDYYLYRLIDGTWESKGTPFVDYRNLEPFKDFHTVIYGHRMWDNTMFGSLGEYFSDSSYYKKFPIIQLYTPERNYDLEIFGGSEVDATDQQAYKFSFADQSERDFFINYVHNINQILGYDQRVDVSGEDEIVMLSTCSHIKDYTRFVVWCKLTPVNALEAVKDSLTGEKPQKAPSGSDN